MHVVLIPAYEPDERLVALVRDLAPCGPVVVVDDGSGPGFAEVFAAAAAAGADVVAHAVNRGKGAALRTGFARIGARWPGADVVTADADGQHTPEDIARVARVLADRTGRGIPPTSPARSGIRTPTMAASSAARQPFVASQPPISPTTTTTATTAPPASPPALVLGVRTFAAGVPIRSRFGNALTRRAFRAATGTDVSDTQTGLRGFPAATLPWLQTVPGDRFEYEFRMLLDAARAGVGIVEVPIRTVYLDGNASSHFRPLADSARIYAPLARFAASALLAFTIDTVLLLVLQAATGSLLLSVVGARIASAAVNFAVNRGYVFRGGRDVPVRTAAVRYLSLAALLLAASFGMLTALTDAGMATLAAKFLTDATLFAVSFSVQRSVVFAPPPARIPRRE